MDGLVSLSPSAVAKRLPGCADRHGEAQQAIFHGKSGDLPGERRGLARGPIGFAGSDRYNLWTSIQTFPLPMIDRANRRLAIERAITYWCDGSTLAIQQAVTR